MGGVPEPYPRQAVLGIAEEERSSMFTVKLYSQGGFRTRILECESLTVLDGPAIGSKEITLHQKDGSGARFDIGEDSACSGAAAEVTPPVFSKAIIENSSGKTTEIIQYALLRHSPNPIGAQFGGVVGMKLGHPNRIA